MFFLDIDNFKNINDSMGHAFGDRVLEAVAEQLRETAGPVGFAARLGGDEFTVVCDQAGSEEAVRAFGWELVRAFQKPIQVNGRDLASASASVPVSIPITTATPRRCYGQPMRRCSAPRRSAAAS